MLVPEAFIGGATMNKADLLYFKYLLVAKQKELSTQMRRVGPLPGSVEPRGDPVDMAASEILATTQIRLEQTSSKLLRAIDDALGRIRNEKFGICEECGEPISRARLEAVPWARRCINCKGRQDPRA